MKNVLIFTLFVWVCSVQVAIADPFLVCDPTSEQVTEYVVLQDGTEYISTPEDLGDGTVRLKYDLGGLTIGDHHFEVAARNDWGTSGYATYDCTKSIPGAPTGLQLKK